MKYKRIQPGETVIAGHTSIGRRFVGIYIGKRNGLHLVRSRRSLAISCKTIRRLKEAR